MTANQKILVGLAGLAAVVTLAVFGDVETAAIVAEHLATILGI